ncbi:hypothetical protein PV04_04117 [Phialophora macrospora]|uniref:Uncharacterized protein n=1 Tax=Phialophora macrospora TaxID=1851006 RepID=A0A0D2CSJ5_9EURO|nr:hypothetical protein PV04_04117 [Phialophora macrospora]
MSEPPAENDNQNPAFPYRKGLGKDENRRRLMRMAAELIWTIAFGIIATAVGLATIWQNFQIVKVKVEVLQRAHHPLWYGSRH